VTSAETLTTAELTILVVDDDADMRYLARMVLEGAGIAVAGEATNGEEALRKLDELDPPPVPTVVLLDNQMPGPTGLEVAARMLAERPDQLIVLFSAYLSDDIVERAEALGIARCVSKGDAINLGEIIRELVAARG
jgi:two-component system, chemotaxis family, chemotaxis protein CheY